MSITPYGGSTVSLTFDAFGRMAEQAVGSSYTQIVYAPGGGKLALMNGQNLLKARVPLPSGGTATYLSAGLSSYSHSDWLGSARLYSTPSQTVSGELAYAPYGETYAGAGTADPSFTGQNSDTVSANSSGGSNVFRLAGRLVPRGHLDLWVVWK